LASQEGIIGKRMKAMDRTVEKKELTCIRCPLGCSLLAEFGTEGEIRSISGNTCKRGEEYARQELISPVRTVTSTVPVEGGERKRVPVKTATDIPKDKIFSCMEEIRKLEVKAPVDCGQILWEDVAGTGVALVATATIKMKQ